MLSNAGQLPPIHFAVVGCGQIGKRHAAMVQSNPSARLTALIDTEEKKNLSLSGYPDVSFFRSLHDFLAAPEAAETHVICIATPNGLHAANALQCLEAGKHVLIEKPIALRKSDGEAVIAKALAVQKHVFAVMQNRYSAPAIWLKELVRSGRLGKIYMVQVSCFWNRDNRYYKPGNWQGTSELDGGTLFTQFSHFIDVMYWLFGDIDNIQARLADHNHAGITEFEDSGIVSFDFVAGGVGCINYSTAVWDKNLESSMTIIAERGSVKIGGQYMETVSYCHVADYSMPSLPAAGDAASNHRFVFQDIIDKLCGRQLEDTNAADALKVVDVIERIYACAGGSKRAYPNE